MIAFLNNCHIGVPWGVPLAPCVHPNVVPYKTALRYTKNFTYTHYTVQNKHCKIDFWLSTAINYNMILSVTTFNTNFFLLKDISMQKVLLFYSSYSDDSFDNEPIAMIQNQYPLIFY